jgi:multiple sugar transport system permease protein
MAVTGADVARPVPRAVVATTRRRRIRPARVLLHAFLIGTCLAWLAPLLWAVYTSLRPYADTATRGYVSLPGKLGFSNFTTAWSNAELPRYYLNTLIVTVPGVLLTLLLASFVGFAVSRYSWRFNVAS